MAWGTKLKYKDVETWIQFKYEQFPLFCFYCCCIGHNERMCVVRKDDLNKHQLKENEYGLWLRASSVKFTVGRGYAATPAQENKGSAM